MDDTTSTMCGPSNESQCSDLADPPDKVVTVYTKLKLIGSSPAAVVLADAAKVLGLCFDVVDLCTLNVSVGNEGTVYVLGDFECPDFNYSQALGLKIFGPTIVLECSHLRTALPAIKRPLYCSSMKSVIVCFTGFKVDRRTLTRLVSLVHHMGGSVRKELTSSVTHLIARSTGGAKYRLACGWGKPIMSEKWILKSWERRKETFVSALSREMIEAGKLKVFEGCNICFQGFTSDEERHMREQAVLAGSSIVDPSNCDHLVVNAYTQTPDQVDAFNGKCHVVSAEWFWASISLDQCANEELYQLKNKAPTRVLSPSSTGSHQKATRHSSGNALRLALYKTTSSDRLGSSSFDVSSDASLCENMYSTEEVESLLKSPTKMMSKRHQVAMELLQTETNYVQILETIVKKFKEPLEEPNQCGEKLLDELELKHIFGNIPAIYQVHKKIRNSLINLIMHWREDRSIGNIWIRHAEEFQKAYPPFINYFETTKEVLQTCDATKPRFHAFLKACQSRPECGRQSLQELLIRPVQRLPSVNLLLNDIIKHTDRQNPDRQELEKAIDAIKAVLSHINEDKRKTEAVVRLFQIINSIDGVEASLLSAHRQLIAQVDAIDLTHQLYSKDATLTLFLFNDCLEVCKKRENVVQVDSNSPALSASKSYSRKPFKHVKMLSLPYIKVVYDVMDSGDLRNIFAFRCRFGTEGRESGYEKVYVLAFLDGLDKKQFLSQVIQNMAATMCNYEITETCLHTIDSLARIGVNVESVNGTISRAMKFAKLTGRRVSRALSFSKPEGGMFKRTLSSMAISANHTLSRMSRANLQLPNLPQSPINVIKSGSGSIKRLATSESFTDSPKQKRRDSNCSGQFLVPSLPRGVPAASPCLSLPPSYSVSVSDGDSSLVLTPLSSSQAESLV